jgi:hypothetical protein
MARLAYDNAREMMASAVDQPDARPGMLGVIQTFRVPALTGRGETGRFPMDV